MKVLIVSSSYSPVLGGLQTVTRELACGLVARGHMVQVVTNRYPRSLPARELIDQVPIHRMLFLLPNLDLLRKRRLDLFLAALYFYPITMIRMTNLVKSFQPDVINIHYPLSQIPLVLWLRKRYPCRLVVSLHGDDILPWVNKINPRLRAILQEADAVTACSLWLLDQASNWEPQVKSKGVAIHNGIDPNRFADKTPFLHPNPYILAYGRLSYMKGFDLLLEAFAQVSPEFPNIELILAGEGEELETLVEIVHNYKLSERVHLLGRATPEKVVQLLNGCHFVVVPSRWEPFGIVALETLAAGKSILLTDVGGLAEFVKSSSSLFVKPSVDELAQGIRRWLILIHGGKLPPPDVGDIHQKYSWENAISKYVGILDE